MITVITCNKTIATCFLHPLKQQKTLANNFILSKRQKWHKYFVLNLVINFIRLTNDPSGSLASPQHLPLTLMLFGAFHWLNTPTGMACHSFSCASCALRSPSFTCYLSVLRVPCACHIYLILVLASCA